MTATLTPEALANLYASHDADSLKSIREKAWRRFQDLGLPTRKHEAFQYVALRKLYETPFELPKTEESPQAGDSSYVRLPLHEALNTYGSFLEHTWQKSLKEEKDPFATLNTVFHRNGTFLYIPPNTVVKEPIVLKNEAQAGTWNSPRTHLFVGKGSQVDLAIEHTGEGMLNHALEITIEENAHVTLSQKVSSKGFVLDAVRATLKGDATFRAAEEVITGITLGRSSWNVTLTGENADVDLSGVALLHDSSEWHWNVFIDHQAPHCHSSQLFKNALHDHAHTSFEGKIMVRQAAQQTDAFQLNSNLLLSDRARADSKPNLEIFADDVKASHGATFGQLDDEQLFYMRSRGVQEEDAKKLLIEGFCEEVLEKIKIRL